MSAAPQAAGANPSVPSQHSLIIHTSNPEAGGAETSLLAAVAAAYADGREGKPLFLVPAEASLARAITARGWDFRVLPWPAGTARLTQSRWHALPLALPGLIPYLLRLRRACRGAGEIWSSGVKSHAACLLLSPWLGRRLVFDIRDFLRPRGVRKAIAWASRRLGCWVTANSRAVAGDFPGASVRYPQVDLRRARVDRRDGKPGGKRIIVHLAYFAPYKGQDLFLECARKLLDAGVDAEFWIIGDVIYPAAVYNRYRERVYALAGRLRLNAHVRFLGRVDGGENVQELLERAHLLLHCTRTPEPFGRAVMEALLCGCEAICHKDSGVSETAEAKSDFPEWMKGLGKVLGADYVRLELKAQAEVNP